MLTPWGTTAGTTDTKHNMTHPASNCSLYVLDTRCELINLLSLVSDYDCLQLPSSQSFPPSSLAKAALIADESPTQSPLSLMCQSHGNVVLIVLIC
ncbi:hypothetical protein SCLCIDRAFT_930672 [Scleroderma citrinum Foug A]|uniref:Uncharacterized protein n=1 Tax=Scleroderma citrinum Foug A TaxID=1036808 RepID=A0A0C3DY40_9AGAM|nr:hypothetical protein SCLCIDRAFT_930672 [Scleroderma citrinum Foug A]